LKRGGTANAVILAILAVGAVLLAAGMFVVFFLVGLFALPQASPSALLYVWDGLVVTMLFFWAIGLLTELQRSEALALDKFLHLPVSLTGAFLVNYLSSLLSLTLIVFLPAMVALSLALVFAKGPAMLLLLPLLAAFLLMVTAVTYQFQGWLASLMANKRRRRTVIVLVTAAFILLCQLPNLLNLLQPWKGRQQVDEAAHLTALTELQRSLSSGQINASQYRQRHEQIQREYEAQKARVQESGRQMLQQVEQTAWLVNVVLPLGWLPLGAMAAAEGNVLPALLGTLGLTLIGAASLWRSYRTTVRLYTGQFSSGKRRRVAVVPTARTGERRAKLLEKHLPWVSEHASAIALAGFRSLTRAPEVKMMLLTPIILVVVFGSIFLTRSMELPETLRSLPAFGAMAMILFCMVQLVGNQFGFDRSGFRVFVLCAAQRKDILLGKNLALAPLPLALGTVMVALVQALYPMRLDHLLAVLPQAVSMYLLFCLLANCLSILAPMPIASGSLKPANRALIPILLHVAFTFLFPLALLPTLLPLGVELALDALGWVKGVPISLILSLLECVAVVYVYRLVLTWQGAWLHASEQKILETVTTKAE
jgi:hypothetical protein